MSGVVQAAFLERIQRTPTVASFRFRCSGPLDFIPGQFLQVLFDPKDPGNRELNKYLSFSCAPGKGYLEVTKRLSGSAFSRRLAGLVPGEGIVLKAPMGNCILRPEQKKIGFLIGGIGITPVISMLEYATERQLDHEFCLVYANRTDEEIAFKEQLDAWRSRNERLSITYLVSDCRPKDASCLFGTIDEETVRKAICDIAGRVFFIFGPPRMVEAMQRLCRSLGCAPQDVLIENFIGYESV